MNYEGGCNDARLLQFMALHNVLWTGLCFMTGNAMTYNAARFYVARFGCAYQIQEVIMSINRRTEHDREQQYCQYSSIRAAHGLVPDYTEFHDR